MHQHGGSWRVLERQSAPSSYWSDGAVRGSGQVLWSGIASCLSFVYTEGTSRFGLSLSGSLG